MSWVFVLILFISPGEIFASPAEEREEFRISLLDRFQDLFGSRINFVANRLDSFFATDRADDELGRSRVRVRSRFITRENARSDLNNQYRVNLKLPHLEEKFRYEYYQENKPLKDKEISQVKKLDRVNRGWLFNADVGVNASIPPRLILRARARRSFETGTLIHRFVEQMTYITDESGLIHDTSIESDHSFSPTLLFRFVNSINWEIINKNFDTQHGPTLLQQLTDNDALSYSALLFTKIDDGILFVNNYQLSVDYRRNLYRQWLYLDLVPGVDFPKEFSFNINPFFVVQLEMLLGN